MTKSTGKLGILGVGHLIQHLVPGLLRGMAAADVLLSPRNAVRAASLRDRYGCAVADSNAQVVEHCGSVMVAVRPFQVEDAIAGLPWRSDQTVVSLCAGVPIAALARHVNGASVVRALPVTAAEFGESPTCLFPDDAASRDLLRPCGPVLALASEDNFEAASVFGAYFGWVQMLIGESADWLVESGLDPETARRLAASMTRAGATMVMERPGESVAALVDELCLPGSFTGLGRDSLRDDNAFDPWRKACSAVLEKSRNP